MSLCHYAIGERVETCHQTYIRENGVRGTVIEHIERYGLEVVRCDTGQVQTVSDADIKACPA